MKKLILSSFVLLSSMGALLAGDCESKDYANVNKSMPEKVLTSNNLQLFKYYDNDGTTRFKIQNLDGTVIAENISRLELRIDFPELEEKFES